jgi:hypothetical protein
MKIKREVIVETTKFKSVIICDFCNKEVEDSEGLNSHFYGSMWGLVGRSKAPNSLYSLEKTIKESKDQHIIDSMKDYEFHICKECLDDILSYKKLKNKQ